MLQDFSNFQDYKLNAKRVNVIRGARRVSLVREVHGSETFL
jgi:hypothetical protein